MAPHNRWDGMAFSRGARATRVPSAFWPPNQWDSESESASIRIQIAAGAAVAVVFISDATRVDSVLKLYYIIVELRVGRCGTTILRFAGG